MITRNPHLRSVPAVSRNLRFTSSSFFPSNGIQGVVKNLAAAVAIYSVNLAASALATTYYVATTGTDSPTNGTSSSPWKTVKYAAGQVPGDQGHTIQIAPGTYTETGGFNLRVGTNLVGAGIDQTILTGNGTIGEGKLVLINLKSNLDNTIGQRLTGFTIDGMDRSVNSGIQIHLRHYVEVDNIKIKDVKNPGIELKSGYNYSTNTTEPADNQYIRGHKIHHNILEHCGRTRYNVTTTGKYWTDWDGAIQIVQDQDCEIYNNTITNTNIEDGAGIKGFNSGGWHRGLKVYNNVVTNARKHVEVAGDTTQWGSTASIEFSKCQDDCEVYNNTFGQWTSFPGGSKGNGTYGLIFRDNRVVLESGGHEPEGIEVSSDQHIHHNYFEGFTLGITTTKPSGTVNVVVHDNVFVGKGIGRPISLGRSGTGYKIYNNTCDNFYSGIYFGGNSTFQDISIKNNVFMNQAVLVNVESGTTLTNLVIDHNLFHNWTNMRTGNQTQPITWSNNLGMTAPGVNPGLVASGSKPSPWYTPASGSSAVVDAGVVIPGFTDGYVGSAPDIGAFEYESGGGGTPPPSGWAAQDVGTVGEAGSSSYSNGVYTVAGAGSSIGSSADSLQFTNQTMSGDGSIVARITSTSMTGTSRIGVMMREDFTAGSKQVMSLMDFGTGKLRRATRSTTNGSTSWVDGAAALSMPRWLKLTREGNVFRAFQSTDGTSWTQVGSSTVTMASSIRVGLAVCSGSTNALNTVTFDNVTVVP